MERKAALAVFGFFSHNCGSTFGGNVFSGGLVFCSFLERQEKVEMKMCIRDRKNTGYVLEREAAEYFPVYTVKITDVYKRQLFYVSR